MRTSSDNGERGQGQPWAAGVMAGIGHGSFAVGGFGSGRDWPLVAAVNRGVRT